MGNGDLKSGAPDITMGMVDVRDVSKAHVIAGFSETAKGRHILSAGTHTLLETGGFIKEKFGDKKVVEIAENDQDLNNLHYKPVLPQHRRSSLAMLFGWNGAPYE